MCYLVNVDHNGKAAHLTKSDCEGFEKCCISSALVETDDIMLWNGSEEDGDVRSQWGEEGSDCEMRRGTRIGTGR
jgi:hypothetical protein